MALAVQLQQEYDRDRAELDIQRAQTRHLSQYSKVVLDSDLLLGNNNNNNNVASSQRSGRRWDAENAESCSDDDEVEEEEESGGEGADEGAPGEGAR